MTTTEQEQRFEALTKANEIRTRRAALKRRLSDSKDPTTLVTVFSWDPIPWWLEECKVETLVLARRGMGTSRGRALLRDCRIPINTTVGELTERQRNELIGRCKAPTANNGALIDRVAELEGRASELEERIITLEDRFSWGKK